MTELPVRRPLKRAPTHPGELMREQIEDHLGLTVSDAADRLKVTRQALHAVLAGRSAVTAGMALRFAKLSGGAPELLLRMQANHDLWHARQDIADALKGIRAVA